MKTLIAISLLFFCGCQSTVEVKYVKDPNGAVTAYYKRTGDQNTKGLVLESSDFDVLVESSESQNTAHEMLAEALSKMAVTITELAGRAE